MLFCDFHIYIFNETFLRSEPIQWNRLKEYCEGEAAVVNMKVVNDTAERGVKLIGDYIRHITKDENGLKDLVQVVSTTTKNILRITKQI